MRPMHDLLTIDQAAREYPFSHDWLRKLCRRGEIVCHKPGRDWLIERASLEAYLATERKPGPSPGRPPKP